MALTTESSLSFLSHFLSFVSPGQTCTRFTIQDVIKGIHEAVPPPLSFSCFFVQMYRDSYFSSLLSQEVAYYTHYILPYCIHLTKQPGDFFHVMHSFSSSVT